MDEVLETLVDLDIVLARKRTCTITFDRVKSK